MNIICFGHLPWSTMWKRNQSIIHHMEQTGIFNKIIFINPYVRITDLFLKTKMQLNNIVKKVSWESIIPRRIDRNIHVLTTIFVGPNQLLSLVNTIITRIYLRYIFRQLRGSNFILVVNDFEPDRLLFYQALIPSASKLIVDLSDDFLAFGDKDSKCANLRSMIDYCVKNADIVLCVNDQVQQKYDDGSGKFQVFKNGIDIEIFKDNVTCLMPSKLASIRRPIIGYMGWISKMRIDYEIVDQLITKFPQCSIIFLGQDVDGLCSELSNKYNNFYYIPAVPFDEMVGYVKQFDVSIIPHKVNEHTAGNDLLKLLVFMAAKSPIVSTCVSGVATYSDIVDIADNKYEFCDFVQKNLENRNDLKLQRGFDVATNNSWKIKVQDFVDTFLKEAM